MSHLRTSTAPRAKRGQGFVSNPRRARARRTARAARAAAGVSGAGVAAWRASSTRDECAVAGDAIDAMRTPELVARLHVPGQDEALAAIERWMAWWRTARVDACH